LPYSTKEKKLKKFLRFAGKGAMQLTLVGLMVVTGRTAQWQLH
jgi:hypothetical protein